MKNPFDFFDGITVINLDKDLDRWVSFVEEAERMGFSDRVVRIAGVYHEVGSFGCASSHKKAVQYAVSRGWKKVLVLEDDVSFLYDKATTDAILEEAFSNITGTDWGLLYLGCTIKYGEPLFDVSGHNPVTPGITVFGEFAIGINLDVVPDIYSLIPDNIDTFRAEHRSDMQLLNINPDMKKIINPCIASVKSEFPSQTGVQLQTRGRIHKSNEARYIETAYIKYGLSLSIDRTARGGAVEVSIIIPAYKAVEYIEAALDSIYAQTYFRNHSYEVLVGVDSCTETLDFLKKIGHRYPMLSIYYMTDNGGPFIIRNTLADISKGGLIVFFDSDDIMCPDLVERVAKSGYGIVQYKIREFQDGQDIYNSKESAWYAYGSIGVSRVLWERAGGFKAWRCAADKEFVDRCLRFETGGRLESFGYYYRRSPNALTVKAESTFGSELRNGYHALMKTPASQLYEPPVYGGYEKVQLHRRSIGLNIFSNCTGRKDVPDMLLRTYESWVSAFGYPDSVRVYLDTHPAEETFLEVCKGISDAGFKIIVTDSLSDGYIRSIKDSEYDFVFQLEHDWLFVTDNVLHSVSEILDCMDSGDIIHLRFNKRENRVAGWDNIINPVSIKGVPLCETDQLSNNPHFINIRLYKDNVLPVLCRKKGSSGIEEVISWKQFRGHIYGGEGYPAVIKHLDGRSKRAENI